MWIPSAIRGRGAAGLVALQAAALAPPAAVVLWQGGAPVAGLLALSLAVALGWDYVFAVLRRRAFEPQGMTTAAIVVLVLPAGVPPWHLIVALSLACVVGEKVFGGRGFGFLSPATVALTLALLSLPGLEPRSPDAALALACLPGALLLLATGVLSLSVALPFLAVLVLAPGAAADPMALATAVSVVTVFLICDPTAAAVTPAGRVLYGLLAAGLARVFAGGAAIPGPEALIFAALMASLMAPLTDHLVLAADGWHRRRRHG